MDFLVGYRDPLFGLIVFFGLIFIVAFFSYWWGIIKYKKQKHLINRFFSKFEHQKKPVDHEENSALKQLALAYRQSGEYEKAISLYLKLQQKVEDLKEKEEVLIELGDLFYKAGFLARSIEIYEEVLRFAPRSKEVLERLMLVYERLNDLEKALQIKDSLEELGVKSAEAKFLETKYFKNIGNNEALVELYRQDPKLVRVVFEYLFVQDPKYAWRVIQNHDLIKIVDILWRLPKEKISLHTQFLKELYTAKGYVKEAKGSSIFELDVLIHYKDADLDFEFLCNECKNIFPFAFTRCPQCQSVGSPSVEMILRPKESLSEERFTV